jgi:hypothetical protein
MQARRKPVLHLRERSKCSLPGPVKGSGAWKLIDLL